MNTVFHTIKNIRNPEHRYVIYNNIDFQCYYGNDKDNLLKNAILAYKKNKQFNKHEVIDNRLENGNIIVIVKYY